MFFALADQQKITCCRNLFHAELERTDHTKETSLAMAASTHVTLSLNCHECLYRLPWQSSAASQHGTAAQEVVPRKSQDL
eukprot:6124558-Amphidinium_carterae.1